MKKQIFKKIASVLLVGCTLSGVCACATPNNSTGSGNSTGNKKPVDQVSPLGNPLFDGVSSAPYTTENYKFTTIFVDGTEKELPQYNAQNPKENEFVTYEVNSNIKDKNYLKLVLETNVDLVGYIHYEKNGDASVTNKEKFFISAGSTQFCTFLDAFRVGAQGAFNKTILSISFQNVDSTKIGTFKLISAGISDRKINTVEEWYISDGSSTLGTSPYYGGCITYYEKLEEDVYEYMDSDGNICIDKGPIFPGQGVRKELPPIGDLSITAIVCSNGPLRQKRLELTPIRKISIQADIISRGILQSMMILTILQKI